MTTRRLLPLITAAVLVTARAHADTPRVDAAHAAAAEQLFTEGRTLMGAKRYAEACPKLEASQRLDPGAGTLLNLAGCYEGAGRTASAWATYREAESTASRSGRPDWAKTARERAQALFPTLSHLVVAVPADARVAGLVVERDGTVVDREVYGEPLATDPGEHVVVAKAPGRKEWSTRVTVAPRGARVDVSVPPLEPAATATAATTTRSPGAAEPAPAPESTRRSWAIAAFALGGATAIAGTVFGLTAKSTYDRAISDDCQGNAKTCTQHGLDTVSDARTQATLSTVFFVTTAAAVAGGIVLWVTAPSSRTAVGVATTPGGAGVVAGGRF